MRRVRLAAAWVVLCAAAPPGGLTPRVGADGLIDASPLFRSEAALRADAAVAGVAIVPGGWRLETRRAGDAAGLAVRACRVLRANGLPAGVRVVVTTPGAKAAAWRCR